MALMMGALYDALRKVEVDDDVARKAAKEVAAYGNRIEKVEGKLNLLQWMLGSNLAISNAILFKVFA